MGQHIKLILIGLISGVVLAASMKIVQLVTGSQAYALLFNYDFIPGVNQWRPVAVVGVAFHYLTCVCSVVVLFYLLKRFHREKHLLPYIITYTAGGGILYFLTALSEKPPAASDFEAWFYWTAGHGLFSLTAGLLIKHWR